MVAGVATTYFGATARPLTFPKGRPFTPLPALLVCAPDGMRQHAA